MNNQGQVEEYYFLSPHDLLSDEVDYELLIRRISIAGSFAERCEWLSKAFLLEARTPTRFHSFSTIQHELPIIKKKVQDLALLLELYPNRTAYLTRLRHCRLRINRIGAFTLTSQQGKQEVLNDIDTLVERFRAGRQNVTPGKANNSMNSNNLSFDPILSSSILHNEGNRLDIAMGGVNNVNRPPTGQNLPPRPPTGNDNGETGDHSGDNRTGPPLDMRNRFDNPNNVSPWPFPPRINPIPDPLRNDNPQGPPHGQPPTGQGQSVPNNENPHGNQPGNRSDGNQNDLRGQIDHYIKETLSTQFSALRAEITQASIRHLEQQMAQGGINFPPRARPQGSNDYSNSGGLDPPRARNGGGQTNSRETVPELRGNPLDGFGGPQPDQQRDPLPNPFGGFGGPQPDQLPNRLPNPFGGPWPRPSTPRLGFPERRNYTIPANKWRIHFSGEPRGMTVNQFISRVETLASNNRITEQELLGQANFLFKEGSEAEDWYYTFCHKFRTWADFRCAVLLRFEQLNKDRVIERQILDRRQWPNETIMAYVSTIEKLAQQLGKPMPEDRKYEILRDNVKDAYKPFLIQYRITNISELLSVCYELDKSMTQTPTPYHRTRQPQVNCLEEEGEWNEGPDDEELNAVGRGGTRYPNDRPREQPRTKPSALGRPHQERYTGTIPKSEGPEHSKPTAPVDHDASQELGAILCWNCRQFGHYWRNCEQDKRVFCHFCGHTNVTTAKCPNSHFLDPKNDHEDRS